ncbi:MAG: SH3 domain-containing protein [Candidatus Acidiferrum sp.]
MKITLRSATKWMILFLFAWPSSVLAQQATANRNVILRRDPTTASPALEHLLKGARLTLVDATPDSGFYHVKTEDDQVGWVFARYVSVSQPVTPQTPITTQPTAAGCDPSLDSHVYHPQRLIVKQQCTTVTGTIVDATNGKKSDGVRHEKDGDTHGWLKVDPEFEPLLNSGNMNDEGGNLVFEIICRFPVTQADAKAACKGYTDQVKLPPVGSHVTIVGTLVQDTFHGQWMEIHPVTSITVSP